MSSKARPHSQSTEAALASIRSQCRSLKLRLTPIRDQVLTLVLSEGKPIKAYDLLERLRGEHARAAPPTVYRALEFLLEHGFVHRLESINAYVSCGHPEVSHQSQFLICDACDSTVELEDRKLAEQLRQAAEDQGFQAASQTIEVHGLCGACAKPA